MKWFTSHWYQYLFEKPRKGWGTAEECLTIIWCRMRGHPAGQVYYNPGGLEPDYRCKDCGEEI